MENAILSLLKNHKVERGKDYYIIQCNIPEDFIYNVSNIAVKWFPSTNEKIIFCNEIPENIMENIYKFNFLDIEKFIEFFEQNLTTFFMGKTPDFEFKGPEILAAGELPANFKFPIYNNVTANIRLDVSKTNILHFCCQNLNIVIKCLKCQEVNSATGNKPCKKCGQDIGFVYVPCLESDKLGYFQPKRSEFVCFNPMKYQFSCEECNKAYESSEIGVNQIYTRKCISCFKELKFKINLLQYFAKKEVKITEGTELPEKGACKHYKKSFRWFRFSCCQSVYPCDECHNEQEHHKAETANRMICGLCSKEQSVKASCDCGMDLNKRKTQFWEGGKGNRDKSTLNRNDSRKNKR